MFFLLTLYGVLFTFITNSSLFVQILSRHYRSSSDDSDNNWDSAIMSFMRNSVLMASRAYLHSAIGVDYISEAITEPT